MRRLTPDDLDHQDQLNEQLDSILEEIESDEDLYDEQPIRAVLRNGDSVVGPWTGHGTDMLTKAEDVWIGEINLDYSEIERFEIA